MRSILVWALAASLPLLADVEDHLQKSVAASAGGKLILNADRGSIQVQPGSSQTVSVEVYFRGDPSSRQEFDRMMKAYTFEITKRGSDVVVNGSFHGQQYSWLRQVEFRVTVPARFDVDANTSGGSIHVGDLEGEMATHTSGGSLRFGRIKGSIRGNTSGGSIRVEDASGDVSLNTSGGSVSADRVMGRAVIHTSGGSIRLGEMSGPVDASTSGGSISVALPSNKGFMLDASTSGGSVSNDFGVPQRDPRHRNSLRGPVNGGGPEVRLHTSGGSIRVRRA